MPGRFARADPAECQGAVAGIAGTGAAGAGASVAGACAGGSLNQTVQRERGRLKAPTWISWHSLRNTVLPRGIWRIAS